MNNFGPKCMLSGFRLRSLSCCSTLGLCFISTDLFLPQKHNVTACHHHHQALCFCNVCVLNRNGSRKCHKGLPVL